jgi:hypothetical protein
MLEADATHRTEQDIGHRGQPHLDSVHHVAACIVDLLVEMARYADVLLTFEKPWLSLWKRK